MGSNKENKRASRMAYHAAFARKSMASILAAKWAIMIKGGQRITVPATSVKNHTRDGWIRVN